MALPLTLAIDEDLSLASLTVSPLSLLSLLAARAGPAASVVAKASKNA
ncbi:MAG TPA: hypothetical protein VJ001_01290 [Rhodocyclaceae bacterium]|nr:hypothetical protein [Rhodocyclaceae bacterium]